MWAARSRRFLRLWIDGAMTVCNPRQNIIRETSSICPVCLDEVAACVVERDGAVYFNKRCAAHGEFDVLISKNPQDYRRLSKSYFFLMKKPMAPSEYYLCATTVCNADCPICFLKQCPAEPQGLSLAEIRKIALNRRVKRFTFSHGEATTCPDLPAMIEILRKQGKLVNIHTNGIRLADLEYVLRLRRSGISQVSLQLDALSESKSLDLRGAGSFGCQLKALENLKKARIPVTLNVTVAKDLNLDEMGRLFDYAVREDFIKDLSFITYCHYDPAREGFSGRYMMPDELVTDMELHSGGKIARKEVVLFQKLFYAYLGMTGIRKCFNYFHYLVVRGKGGYLPVGDFIDLDKAAAQVDLLEAGQKPLTVPGFLKILLLSLKLKSLWLLPRVVLMLARRGSLQASGMFLSVTFATICDPYKYDSAIAVNCGQGIAIKDAVHDSYGAYLMQEMARKKRVL